MTSAERIRQRERLLPDDALIPGVEYRAMLNYRWYRVQYIKRSGEAGGKPMHKFRWITGPRAGQIQDGWAGFREATR